MKIVVIGCGKIGFTLIEHLVNEKHEVIVVDKVQRVVSNTVNKLDVIGLCGNGASIDIQIEAGVPSSDLVIACTNSDELNLLCCLFAKTLGVPYTVARVRNPEYINQIQLIRNKLGISLSINPEYVTALEIFRMLRFPSALEIDTFSNGNVELVGFKVAQDSPLNGLALKNFPEQFDVRVLVCVVQRGGDALIPSGDFVIQSGDILHIAASHSDIEEFFRKLGILKKGAQTVILIGGSRIAYYLAEMLIDVGVHVKIIESDNSRCIELCELLPKAIVISGDGADQDVLFEEGLDYTDSIVALTGSDEENIIISMFSSIHGVSKVITKVSRPSLSGLVSAAGLDSVVSPREITANLMLQYVRALQNSVGSNIETLHKLVDGKVEALEFAVREDSKVIGIPLKDLDIRKNILLACITRNGEIIIPKGNTTILKGDNVIIVTTNEGLDDIADILK